MRHGCICTDQQSLNLIDEGRRTFGIGMPIKALTIHQLKSPATFDWYWPTILLPENFALMPVAEKKALIGHELARIRRADSLVSILLAIVQIFHWWNPIFWWTRWRWLSERELACDQLAIYRMNDSEAAEFLRRLQSLGGQQSKPNRSSLLADATGFVMFDGGVRSLQTRIVAAAQTCKFESRWRQWASFLVVATLSVVALTDAIRLPLRDSPIELPAGTIWEKADSASSPGLITRRYGLDPMKSAPRQSSVSRLVMNP